MQYCKLAFDKYTPPKNLQKPILILHGLFGSRQNSRSIAQKLKDFGSQVYTLDLRNHGDSEHNHVHTYRTMALDVANFIKQNRIATPHVIGHSMGAKTAMALALLNPTIVDKIVAVDNAPVNHTLPSDFAKYLQGMHKLSEMQTNRQRDLFETLKPYCPDLTVAYFILSNFKRTGPQGIYKPRIPLKILESSLQEIASFEFTNKVSNELMLIKGTKSPFVPPQAITKTCELFPNTTVAELNCGHWVIQEQPKQFLDLVTQFLFLNS